MNAKNALGMFGGIVSKIIGFAVPKLERVPDEAVEWVKSDEGSSALQEATEAFVDALLVAYEAFKVEAVKLFIPVGERNFPGSDINWKAGEFFTTNNPTTKFGYVDPNLLKFLSNDEIQGSPGRKLTINELKRNAKDSEILPRLGSKDLTPAELRWLIEKANLSRGKYYVVYITHLGVRFATYFDLGGSGWCVSAYPVPRERDWGQGVHFVSPAIQNLGT